MNKLLLAAVSVLLTTLPASAQYHYSYGDSRVVNQNQTGLYTPSATYIGAGTLSRSAQGKGAGVGAILPQVNMGSHVRTAGDNLYNDQGTMRSSNGSLMYQDDYARALAAREAQIRRQQQIQMMRNRKAQQQQLQKPQGFVYVPGSNGAAASYANTSAQAPTLYRGGAATYGSVNTGSDGRSSARQF